MIKESIFECPSIKALHPSSGSYMPAIATSDGDSRFFDPLTGKKATSISYNLHGAGANSYVIIREDAYWKQKSMHYFSSTDVVENTIVAEPDFKLEDYYLVEISQQNPASTGMAYDKTKKNFYWPE
ncbi:hypothetical protein [Pantoea agglomerans]|uniref:hypothetical protein n=2 Tax=Enterobacter agglomerans TaxID=549 RepID=UPI003C7E7273